VFGTGSLDIDGVSNQPYNGRPHHHRRPHPKLAPPSDRLPQLPAQPHPAAFGHIPSNKITRQAVKVFIKDLKSWLADSSAASTLGLLSLVMREAVADRRFGRFHPCQSVRAVTSHRAERSTATTAEGRPHRRPDRPPR
jgi:hypothetical protein